MLQVTSGDPQLLTEALTALGDWRITRARELAEQVLLQDDSPMAHEILGGCAHLDDSLTEARSQLEQAFRGYRSARDADGAARCAIQLAGLLAEEHGHSAASQAWLQRARAQLEDVGAGVQWGYLELAVMGCYRPDPGELLAAGERALTIAREHGDTELEVRALADTGLALVSMGRVAEGFSRLDLALVAISAGEVSPVTAGIGLCSMLTACDRAQDTRRASEWCEVAHDVLDGADDRPRALRTHCRVVYGAVLGATGHWSEAEAQMLDALGPAAQPSATHRELAVAHLAQLRLDQGRIEDAEALLGPFEDRIAVAAPLARVHMARGSADLASAVLRRALAEIDNDALRAVPLYSLLVEAELQAGDLAAAQAACGSLVEVATSVDLPVMGAEASTGCARVARAVGDLDAALSHYERSVSLLADGLRPALAVRVHTEVAELHLERGDRAAAVVAARSALACGERLGAPAGDKAAALLRSLGETPSRSSTSGVLPDDLTDREKDVLALLGAGLTNAQIGERLYISAKTVEHHVSHLMAKLGVQRRTAAAAVAVRAGLHVEESGGE